MRPDEIAFQQYNGNGVTTNFGFPHQYDNLSELLTFTLDTLTVGATEVLVTAGITKNGVGTDTGSVDFDVAPPTGTRVTLVRDTVREQDLDYVSNQGIPAESHEDLIDTLVGMVQDMQQQLDRCIQLPRSVSQTFNNIIPNDPLAGSAVFSNSSNNGLEFSLQDLSDLNQAVLDAQAAQLAAENASQSVVKVVEQSTPDDTIQVIAENYINEDRTGFVKAGLFNSAAITEAAAGNARLYAVERDNATGAVSVSRFNEVALPGDPFTDAPSPNGKKMLAIVRVPELSPPVITQSDITTFEENNAMPTKNPADEIGVEWETSSASTLTIKSGTKFISSNSGEVRTFGGDEVIDITATGANGRDQGAEVADTW